MTAPAAPVALVDYLRLATDYLHKSGSDSARLDAELLLGHVLDMDRMSLYVNFDRPLHTAEVDDFRQLLRRRGRGEPVAYITGRKEFRGFMLETTPAALIPRPETELLVEAVVERLAEGSPSDVEGVVDEVGDDEPREATADGGKTGVPWVADVGTGSGAVALALAAALPGTYVAAVDISEEALDLARRNAETHGVGDRIHFLSGDLLEPLLRGDVGEKGAGGLDAVVSNPPYVTSAEWDELPKDVRKFEPRLALDGGADGLDCYRRLLPQAWEVLKPGGLLAVEIGADQGSAVAGLLTSARRWRGVEVLTDYSGRDRIVLAVKPS